ncbi:MAG: hypothetical protein Q4G19_03585 [Clostridia bacterium]|nr:hypothetical protein [Clostridia bacterium]
MYDRYSQALKNKISVGERNRGRIKNIIILLLILVIAGLCVYGIPRISSGNELRTLYIRKMQSECDEALRQTNVLSRNAGADTSANLARIRSNVYSIEQINTLSASLPGETKTLIDGSVLSSIRLNIDTFLSVLATGMDTGEYVTDLQTTLDTVRSLLSSLV